MEKIAVIGLIAGILLLGVGVNAAAVYPSPIESPIINEITSPQNLDQLYYSVNEGQILTFTETWGNIDGHWRAITTDRYVMFGGPIWTNENDLASAIPGATMPWSVVLGQASSTFTWTPNYCQSRPMDYAFRVLRYQDTDPYTNPIGFTHSNMTNITVNNVNRPPRITSNLDIDSPTTSDGKVNVAVGGSLTFNIAATDDDNTQCNEGAFLSLPVPSMSSWSLLGAAVPSIVSNPNPQTESGVRSFTIGPFDSTQIGKWDLKFSVNDGGTGNNNSTSNMTINVYQPSSGSSCGYSKYSKYNVRNMRYCS